MRIFLVVLLLISSALLAASRFWPVIERLEVFGEEHLSRAEVLRLANVAPGDPLLWVTRMSLRGLEREPWVLQAWVTRHWPDTVAIRIVERQPLLSDGTVAWSEDGTELHGTDPERLAALPRLEGWGSPRLAEAIELLHMLVGRGVRVITYGPEGFEVELEELQLFTPSVDALRSQWSAFESQRGGRVAVYPWGVSSAP